MDQKDARQHAKGLKSWIGDQEVFVEEYKVDECKQILLK